MSVLGKEVGGGETEARRCGGQDNREVPRHLAKEEAYVNHSDVKEEKKARRFNLLMEATQKKLKLEEKKKGHAQREEGGDRSRCGGHKDVDLEDGGFR